MINLIVTRSGYVESNQMATLFWRRQQGKPLPPEEALCSLVNELAAAYKEEFLFSYDTHAGHTHKISMRDRYENIYCSTCGKPLRDQFDPHEFTNFIRSLSSAVASGGVGDFSIGELHTWWPWNRFEEVRKVKPSQVLLVEESFDTIAVSCIKPDEKFTEDEKQIWKDHAEEAWGFKIKQGPDKFWRAETDYGVAP